jgi:hypothetical protein
VWVKAWGRASLDVEGTFPVVTPERLSQSACGSSKCRFHQRLRTSARKAAWDIKCVPAAGVDEGFGDEVEVVWGYVIEE